MPIYSPDIFCFRIKMAATTTTVTSTPFTDIGTINVVAGTPCTPGWSPPPGPGPGPGPGYTPPLDDFGGAIAAFSVRLLSSSYSGFCCQVTRASDSATLDVPFASNGLVDVDAINTFDDGSAITVTAWYDQTNSGNDFISTTSTFSTLESKPGIQGQAGLGFSNSGISIPADFTLASVTGYTNNNIYFGGSGSSTFFNYAINGNDENLRYRILGGTRDFIVPARKFTEINVGTRTSGALNVRHQGNIYSSSPINTSFQIDFLGRFPLYHQEYIIYNSALTEPQTLSLTQNLNSYYQVTNLPDFTSGFLADYPDATVAYSVRQLSNTAIKCMRVRRAVAPFDEQDIGFTPGGDLDEAAIVAFGGSDELRVSAWYDQSGQSRHATQITPGAQPQIYDGTAVVTENGKPAIRTIGQAQYMGFSNINIDAAGAYTSFAAKGTQTDWGSPVTAGAFIRTATSIRVYGNNQNLYSFASSNNFDRYVLTARKDNRDYDMYKGTTNIDSRTLGVDVGNTFNQILKGASFDANSVPDNGFLHEVIIYDSAKSDTDVTAIQNNIITEFY